MLSKDERIRYGRQMLLPEIAEQGQEALKAASVLVVGAGGLGSPVLTYLTAAGVGRIGIIDNDRVERSNLHRQILFGGKDIGRWKAEVAAEKLSRQNHHIDFDIFNQRLNSNNGIDIISNYDIVVDGSDNFPTKYLVNDACVLGGKTLVYGAIHQFEGQVSVFNYPSKKGRGPNYRDLFPQPPPPGQIPNCAEAGVLGTLPGIVGSLQANEVIKIILKQPDLLSGILLLFDARDVSTLKIKIAKTETNPLTGTEPKITKLIDYHLFCGIAQSEVVNITKDQYIKLSKNEKSILMVDVREKIEVDAIPFNGIKIPLSRFVELSKNIPLDSAVVFVCRSGRRSEEAVRRMIQEHGEGEYYSLNGGVEGW